ncbi:TraI domain-containing protein [Cupriavidus sp. AU9028]|uniref:TraI domain-containing protein n=1 Tax=Cupriavidus sp. AU9028 TaxID=2871157 RepID=UPI001C98575D|nr:TraI domain-containing protein [Cupriavidus sp. AU9028]MBY4898637.1 TraI domain-containing protein [Cupriavidus sp. AU9028]
MMHVYLSPEELVATHAQRVELIRQYANEGDPTDFDKKWVAVLNRCAAWFSSMPLRPDQHAEPGGAFRATIEATYFAMRLSGAQKFAADQTSERRRKLEPQYLYALFLAAACSRLDEPCRHFQFFRNADGAEWIPAIHGAFGAWLAEGGYSVARREASLPVERMRTALLAREILGVDRLSLFEPQVLTDLFGSINPDPKPAGLESLLHKVVRQALDTTTQFEVKARRAAFAPDLTPAPSASLMSAAGEPTAPRQHDGTPSTEAPSPPPVSTVTVGPLLADDAADPADRPRGAEARPAQSGPLKLDGTKSLRRPAEEDPFKEVLGSTSNLMRDFFRALAQDVAVGKVRVSRIEDKVAISKRMLGNYGIASDTLIENLRKFQLLYKTVGQDILLVDRVGNLISMGAGAATAGEAL